MPPLSRRAFAAALACVCLPGCTLPMGRGGRTLRVLIGGTPGSSYDRLARLLAAPLAAQLDDRRLILLLRPAAGGMLMAKQLAEGPRDGSLIGYVPSGLIYAELLNEPGVAFELRRFRWLASATAERRVLLLSNRLGLRTLDDVVSYGRPLNVSANAVGSPTWVSPLVLNSLLGTRLRPVPGYPNAAREAAVMGGEVDGVLATVSSGTGLLASGAVTPIVRLSPGAAPAELDEVPVLGGLVSSLRWRPLIDLIEAHDDFGRAVAAPPETPEADVNRLRRAFDAILTDGEVVAAAARSGLVLGATRGEAVAQRLDALFADGGAVTGLLEEAVHCGLERARGASSC